MTKEELNQSINQCIQENCGIEVYFGLKNGEIRKANFFDETQEEMKSMFIQKLHSSVIDADLSLINLSSADDRTNAIYQYDLDRTEEMRVFDEVADGNSDISNFSFDEDGVSEISFFLIVIGSLENRIVIYKQLATVNIYTQRTGFYVWRHDNMLEKIDNDFLRIVPGIDIFQINSELFILNLDYLERKFNIHAVIETAARSQIEIIGNSGLVENSNDLLNDISDVSFARKLSKIAEHSPVLNHIENDRIITFTHQHPALSNIFQYSEDGSKIKLITKKSKIIFLKLLNDDYLNSDLTNKYYDSLAKDDITNNAH